MFFLISIGMYAFMGYPQFEDEEKEDQLKFIRAAEWADSILLTMSLDEKIGQLFMLRAHSNKSVAYKKQVAEQIKNIKPGGLCFFQGGPLRQSRWTEKYQAESDIPLFIAIDGEWGLGMRLDSTLSYPFQMTLGAIQDNYLISMMGESIAREMKAIGVNMNFAPVMDVNSNPNNPVINFRSFGENPERVYHKAMSYASGLQSKKVIACGKHFPGHGDTNEDSHFTLPVIQSTRKVMEDIHLMPFRKAAQSGIGAMMSAHVYVPALDSIENRPASLSPVILKNLLKEKYQYGGLIVTDALEMEGVKKERQDAEIVVEALQAGNDILLLPENPRTAVDAIKEALKNKTLSLADINKKVRKILLFKYWAGLNKPLLPRKNEKIRKTLELEYHQKLIYELYKEALTMLKNDSLIPLGNVSTQKIAVVSVGQKKQNHFLNELRQYIRFDEYFISSTAPTSVYKAMVDKLAGYDLVITGMHTSSLFPRSNYGMSQAAFDFTEIVGQKTKNIILHFGNPYALKKLGSDNNASAIVVAYQNNQQSQKAAVKGLFGATDIRGKLPVSIDDIYQEGFCLESEKIRLEERHPFFMNIDTVKLQRIEEIAMDGIRREAYPGCQILVARDGEVFFHKAFGHHTYNETRPVQKTDLYDLASVTKIAAATLAIMKLQENGQIDIDQYLSTYLPELKNTDKQNIILREMMAHQAGLHSWIPFYKNTINKAGVPSPLIYKAQPDSVYNLQVADQMYIASSYRDTIIKEIKESGINVSRRYKYSDLGFYLLKYVIDTLTGQNMADYLQQTYYSPMGLQRMVFHPLKRFQKREIIPTEDDQVFRNQLIHGHVHDPGAAMMGGTSGHAGLFSNAADLAAIMQMLLNNGAYAGTKFLDSATVNQFTSRQFPLNKNRRGIGFDKPLPDNKKGGPTTPEASNKSFGHSGFTGTYAWADPEYELVYIFLSNRIYPDAENRKLIQMDIRTKIQKVIYQSMQSES
ncbi:MAG: glycoside hydrolase family 3 N-terminal domain-containing protein [Bacteroidales bacterium]